MHIAHLGQVRCATRYDGWVKETLITYKNGDRTRVKALARVLATVVPAGALVVPVPSHQRKVRQRGFDTVTELVAHLVQTGGTGVSMLPVLRQVRLVPDQVGLTQAQRARNVAGTFAAERLLRGQVVLVDDVVTTGATMREAARALIQAGADTVLCVALCRANRLG